MIDDVVIVTVL